MCFDLRHFILFYLMRPRLYLAPTPPPPFVSPCSLLCCPFGACEMHFWWQLMEFLLPLKRALWWPDQNTPRSYKSLPFPPTHFHSQSQLTWHLFVLHGTGEREEVGRGLCCANDCWGLAYFIKVSQTLVGWVERYLLFFWWVVPTQLYKKKIPCYLAFIFIAINKRNLYILCSHTKL